MIACSRDNRRRQFRRHVEFNDIFLSLCALKLTRYDQEVPGKVLLNLFVHFYLFVILIKTKNVRKMVMYSKNGEHSNNGFIKSRKMLKIFERAEILKKGEKNSKKY